MREANTVGVAHMSSRRISTGRGEAAGTTGSSRKLKSLFETGKLLTIARECATQQELARRLKMTIGAWKGARRRLVQAGVPVPSFREMLGAGMPATAKEAPKKAEDAEALVNLIKGGADGLRAFGTPMERACVDALLLTGGVVSAATRLGLTPTELQGHLAELRKRAAARGYAPGHLVTDGKIPDGFHVKGVSTLFDAGGKIRTQWVRTRRDDQDRLAAMVEALGALGLKGVADPVRAPPKADSDLLAVYPLGDPHLGMYAWAKETGTSFDLDIAEHNLCSAMDHLVALAPRAGQALIANLGDFFHADNTSNRTARSGHALDVDTRWAKVLGVGIKAMRRLIDRALEKHARVRVVNAIGNHDDHSSVFLALALAQFYEREPRVEIDAGPGKFHWHRFGKCLIGITHGDTVKARDLPGVMAADRAEDWGQTEHRFWYCGHVHHDSLKEFPGVVVETFRTLAARDAWHQGAGYRAQRDAKLDILHREWGRVQRHVVGINQVTATRR